MNKKTQKSIEDFLERVGYVNSMGEKYHNNITGKTNGQITVKEVFGDLIDVDKRLNNGKGVKQVQNQVRQKISQILDNLF